MLVVKLKPGECVQIGDAVVIVLKPVRDGKTRLGVTAPDSVKIRRLKRDDAPEPGTGVDDEFSAGIL